MDSSQRLIVHSHEVERKAQWRGKPTSFRLREMDRLVILHPQFVRAIMEIKQRVGHCVRHHKGSALSVIAPTGAGKSTVASYCANLWLDRELPDMTLRRVVVFSVPPRPSSGSMSSAVLKALGDPRWSSGKAHILEERAKHLLTRCRTRLVLIDNVQDVPERRKRKGVREVGNWIRDMVDSVPALFVSLGAEQSLDVFNANSQVRRRSPARLNIDYFSIETPEKAKRFLRLLFELDKKLPLADMSNLAERSLATRIWMATHGIIDYLMDMVCEAVAVAANSGREALALTDFERAFEKIFLDAAPAVNPFAPDATLRRLDAQGEPFFEWLEDGYE